MRTVRDDHKRRKLAILTKYGLDTTHMLTHFYRGRAIKEEK